MQGRKNKIDFTYEMFIEGEQTKTKASQKNSKL